MLLFNDGFDIYGDGDIDGDGGTVQVRATQGRWAEMGNVTWPMYPSDNESFDARTGVGALRVGSQSGSVFQGARVVLSSTLTELFVSQAVYKIALPQDNNTNTILGFRGSANDEQGALYLQSNGSLEFKNNAGSSLGSTPANTFRSGTWHHIAVRIVKSATVGVFELRVDGVTVLNLTNQNTGASGINQLRWHINDSGTDLEDFFLDDLHVNDATGAYNNTWPGDVRVAAIYAKSDDETGWTANRREKFGNGILQLDSAADALSCADNTQFEMGTGDFTMEAWIRFLASPAASDRMHIFSKWRDDNNTRSYRLFLGGASVNGGKLQFETSTDGTAGTEAIVTAGAFAPVLGRWHHIAVQRSSGETVIFADGVPLNAPAADAANYHDNSSLFYVGGQQSGSTGVEGNQSIEGFMDEVRVTKGVARYNPTGFAVPSAAFGRSVGTDASFASVSLLLGFDTDIIDESSFARAVTARGAAARFAIDDAAPGAYKTVNQATPRDDTGVEAPYIQASNVLTFSDQPANNDTVTVDGNVYTFKTVFVDVAGNVLIGATISDSIDNLVAAINGDTGAGTLYGTGTVASDDASALNIDNDQMRVTATIPGTAGNSITATESSANLAWSSTGGTLAGGLDIPAVSSFLLGRLPSQATAIRGMTLVTRARKTDTGAGTVQASFVTADNSSKNGAAHPLAVNTAYFSDVIEEDPSTLAVLTPSSFTGARFRVDRTE